MPFLILGATILLAMQELITRRLQPPADDHETPTHSMAAIFFFQLLVGVYGAISAPGWASSCWPPSA